MVLNSSSQRPPMSEEFEVGFVMAGAVSAGAYSAGVMDFITEALDAYEIARTTGRTAEGEGWGGPTHSGAPPLVWRGAIRRSGCRAQGDRLHAGASLGRGLVSQGRVQALPLVKHLDVLEHRRPRLRAGAEPGLMDALRLERGEEALHGRIIETIAAPAHRWLD